MPILRNQLQPFWYYQKFIKNDVEETYSLLNAILIYFEINFWKSSRSLKIWCYYLPTKATINLIDIYFLSIRICLSICQFCQLACKRIYKKIVNLSIFQFQNNLTKIWICQFFNSKYSGQIILVNLSIIQFQIFWSEYSCQFVNL